MKFPSALYGSDEVVRENMLPIIEHFVKHEIWPESFVSFLIDTRDISRLNPEVKVDFYLAEFAAQASNFRLYTLIDLLYEMNWYSDEIHFHKKSNIVFDQLIDFDWGVLCLISGNAPFENIGMDIARKTQFFRKFIAIFDTLLNEKSIFVPVGSPTEMNLAFWNSSFSTLFPLMIRAGVPFEAFDNHPNHRFNDNEAVKLIRQYILEE